MHLLVWRVVNKITCSAGFFFWRANVFLAKAHVENRGENGASQKEWGRGPLPSFALAPALRVTVFTLPNLPPSQQR